ncbi:unnamed protein product, partial [Ectocarpus sp. 8 AP-2014]
MRNGTYLRCVLSTSRLYRFKRRQRRTDDGGTTGQRLRGCTAVLLSWSGERERRVEAKKSIGGPFGSPLIEEVPSQMCTQRCQGQRASASSS